MTQRAILIWMMGLLLWAMPATAQQPPPPSGDDSTGDESAGDAKDEPPAADPPADDANEGEPADEEAPTVGGPRKPLAEVTPESWPPKPPQGFLPKDKWQRATDFEKTAAKGKVMDFCAMKAWGDAAVQYQKKKVLWLMASNMELLDQDPWLKHMGAQDMAREAWTSRLPLERFHNVLTGVAGQDAWVDKDKLTYDEVDAHILATDATRPFAGPQGRIEDEKRFVLYSLRCVDYIMVSTVRAAPVGWGWRQIRAVGAGDKKGVYAEAYQLYLPRIQVTGATTAFRRNGDFFEKVATFKTDKVGNIDQDKNKPGWDAMPDHVSAIPKKTCKPSYKSSTEGGLDKSCQSGVADATMIAHAHYEVNGRVCEERSKINVEGWIRCEPRTATESFIGDVHIQIRRHPEFMLYGRLQTGVIDDAEAPAIALGDDEGVKVGYGFAVVDDDGWMQTYYKVTDVGPGGPAGAGHPSEMNLRFGDVPKDGTRLEEYALTGFSMWLKAYGGGLFLNDGITPITTGPLAGHRFGMPKFLTGGTIGIALDWGGLVDVPELYTKADFSVLYGTNGTTDVIMYPVDWPWIEKGFYAGKRLKIYIGGGLVWNAINVILKPDGEENQRFNAFSFGGAAEVGLEVMFRPDFFLRAEAHYRMVAPPDYNDDEEPMLGEFAQRNDLLGSASGRVGLGYEF